MTNSKKIIVCTDYLEIDSRIKTVLHQLGITQFEFIKLETIKEAYEFFKLCMNELKSINPLSESLSENQKLSSGRTKDEFERVRSLIEKRGDRLQKKMKHVLGSEEVDKEIQSLIKILKNDKSQTKGEEAGELSLKIEQVEIQMNKIDLYKPQIEEIKKADQLLFIVKKDKGKDIQKHEDFMDFPTDEIEESMLSSSKKGILRLKYENGKNTQLVSDKQIKELREQINQNEEGGEEIDIEKRLLLRLLWITQVYVNWETETLINFCKESFKHIKNDREKEYIKILEERLASLYWTGYKSTEKEYKEALNTYVNVTRGEFVQHPTFLRRMTRCHNNIALIHKLRKKYTQSELNYEQAENYASRSYKLSTEIAIRYRRADVLRSLGFYNEAEEKYEGILSEGEDEVPAVYQLALTQLEHGKYEDAKKNLDEFHKRTNGKTAVEIRNYRKKVGFLHYKKKEYKEAKEAYEEELKENKNLPHVSLLDKIQTMYYLALVYMKLGDDEKNREMRKEIQTQVEKYDWDTGLSQVPLKEKVQTIYNLALICMKLGEKEGLRIMYRKIHEVIREQVKKESEEKQQQIRRNEINTINSIEKRIDDEEHFNNNLYSLQLLINARRSKRELDKIRTLLKKLESFWSQRLKNLDRLWIINIRFSIAHVYEIQNETQKAEEVYLKIIKQLEHEARVQTIYGTEYNRCHLRLINLYMAGGELTKIENYFKGIINDKEKIERPYFNHIKWLRIDFAHIYLSYEKNEKAKQQYEEILSKMEKPLDVHNLLENQRFFDLTDRLYSSQKEYLKLENIYTLMSQIEYSSMYRGEDWESQSQEFEKDWLNYEITWFLPKSRTIIRGWEEGERKFAEMQTEKRKTEEDIKSMMAEPPLRWGFQGKIESERLEKIESERLEVAPQVTRKILELKEREKWAWKRLADKRLMSIYRKTKRNKEAEKLCKYNLRLAIEDKREGAAFSMREELAKIFWDQREWRKSEILYNMILRYKRQKYWEEHPETAMIRYFLSEIYGSLKVYEEARRLYHLALEFTVSFYGKKHPFTLKKRKKLLALYKKSFELCLEQGNHGRAIDILKKMKDEFKEEKINIDDFEKRLNEIQKSENLALNEEENDIESYVMMQSIINEILWYYDRVSNMEYKERVLKDILKSPYWSDDQYMTLELAEQYDKQEQYPKVMRLYYGTILNEVENIKETRDCVDGYDEGVIIKVIQLLSKAYIMSYPEKRDFVGTSNMIWRALIYVESKFGCTNMKGIGEAKENLNRGYLQQQKYVQFALRQNNKAMTDFSLRNFLNTGSFEARITPITCMIGDNDSGKTTIIKILHACQKWLHNDREGFEKDKSLSKNSLLNEIYAVIKEKVGQQGYGDGEINLLKEKDFFCEELKRMIKSQINYIIKYFKDNNENQQDTWKKVIGKQKETELRGENCFFGSKVSVFEEDGTIEFDVSLDWNKIKELTLKIEGDVAQLRMDIKNGKELLTLYYYIAKQEGMKDMPFYKYSATQFFVRSMNVADLQICITNILFECTPFVFLKVEVLYFQPIGEGYPWYFLQLQNWQKLDKKVNIWLQ